MDRFLIRKMLGPVASERAHIAPSPTAGYVGGPPGPPTPRAVRSGGRFGSRVRPRHIAMDTRAADAVLPAAAGGLAAGKKARNRLSIEGDARAMPVDLQYANAIVEGRRTTGVVE